MKVLIVEDERIAFEKLKNLLHRIAPEYKIIGNGRSVEESIDLIQRIKDIDLAFFDIQLEDGLSFSILDHVRPDFPIIFTTAYGDYAIRAFDHHSISYLLKPIQKVDLEKALIKFDTIQPTKNYKDTLIQAIHEARKVSYKERFTVRVGSKIRLFEVDEIACFFSQDKGSYISTTSGKEFLIDSPIEQIEALVDPSKFFRINRKHLIHISAIARIIQFTNSRLKIDLKKPFHEDLVVAREKVKLFKEWLEG